MKTATTTDINDLQGLNRLKLTAKANQREALPEAARQFEAIFIQSMLKSMRSAGDIFSAESLFQGKDKAMFEEMLDQQLSLNMANDRGIGLAQSLIDQIERNLPGEKANSQGIAMSRLNSTGKALPLVVNKLPVKAIKTTPVNAGDKAEKQVIDNHYGIFESAKDFVQTLWPHAKAVAKKIGLDPKLLIAQAALETGWGKYVSKDSIGESSNNLFNIKTGTDDTIDAVKVKTKEFIGGKFHQVVASFRKYDNLTESFNDYLNLISKGERYQLAMDNVAKPEQFIKQLHQAGYATDPKYADKVLSIYHGGELKQYIEEMEVNP